MEIEGLIEQYIPQADAVQRAQFARYYALLVDWNQRVNLTAVTEAEEVAAKHFADSLLPAQLIPAGARCIDVGTGAGFPGVPLMIMRGDLKMTLLDSLRKRLTFLDALLRELNLSAALVHMRAEDAGRDNGRRGHYDVAFTRAVAGASVLMEWTAPLLKIGGLSLMYKGPRADEELASAQHAQQLLKMETRIVDYDVPWGERHLIVAKKLAPTPKDYPRKAGAAAKNPL